MSEHVSIIEVPRTEHNNPIIVEKYSDGSSAIQQESNHYPHSSPTKYIPIEPVQLDPLIVALGGAAQARIATLTDELATKSLTWTTEKPTVDGWYWNRDFQCREIVVQVWEIQKRLMVSVPGTKGMFSVEVFDGKWAGPITQRPSVTK